MFVKAVMQLITSHNPYFNRWFSAISFQDYHNEEEDMSQSLF